DIPLLIAGAPEIIHHQESTPRQVLAQAQNLSFVQSPPADLGGVDPGVIEKERVGEAEMARIAGIDAGEALDAGRKVIIGIRPVHQPPAGAPAVAGAETVAAMV